MTSRKANNHDSAITVAFIYLFIYLFMCSIWLLFDTEKKEQYTTIHGSDTALSWSQKQSILVTTKSKDIILGWDISVWDTICHVKPISFSFHTFTEPAYA